MHIHLFLLSCISRAREHCCNIHPLLVVAVLLDLLCLCSLIFVALSRRRMSYAWFCSFKHTPESIEVYTVSQMYPYLIIFWCFLHALLHYLTRRCWDCCRHFWRIYLYRLNWNISPAHTTANTRHVPTLDLFFSSCTWQKARNCVLSHNFLWNK